MVSSRSLAQLSRIQKRVRLEKPTCSAPCLGARRRRMAGHPPRNLGFVDSRASTISITVAGVDLTIHQSPTLLLSNRAGGTTGAVVWKITPLFAAWLASPDNVFFATSALSSASAVLEQGCGISGITGLVVGPNVSRFVLTDQSYVSRILDENLEENSHLLQRPAAAAAPRSRRSRSLKSHGASAEPSP